MTRLRAFIVASLTLALAAFPLAGVSTPAAATEGPAKAAAAHTDCAKHAQTSQAEPKTQGRHAAVEHESQPRQAQTGQAKAPCDDHSGCGGNCLCLGLGLTAVLPAASGAAALQQSDQKSWRFTSAVQSQAYIPPPPPPRV